MPPPNKQSPDQIIRILKRNPLSAADLAAKFEMSGHHIRQVLRAMKAKGMVHVSGYAKSGNHPERLWGAGNGIDAVKPPPLPRAERRRMQRDTKKKVDALKPVKVIPLTMAGMLGL